VSCSNTGGRVPVSETRRKLPTSVGPAPLPLVTRSKCRDNHLGSPPDGSNPMPARTMASGWRRNASIARWNRAMGKIKEFMFASFIKTSELCGIRFRRFRSPTAGQALML
jgi:hypothetical protein